MDTSQKEKTKTAGMLFAGCLFAGMAAGYFFHQMTVGVFAGLGLGFLASAAYRSRRE